MRIACLLVLLATTCLAAEFNTDNEGGPKVTFVKMLYRADLREYWAWVTLEHEDWPIETRRFVLPPEQHYPEDIPNTTRTGDPDWRDMISEDDLDKVYARSRRFNSPYKHYVDWWSVIGPKGEKIHRRDIEYPHPGGWPFKLLERGIKVPTGITTLTFKAHDPVHGYGTVQVTVDLLKKKGPNFEVEDTPIPKWSGRLPTVKKWFRSPLAHEVDPLW